MLPNPAILDCNPTTNRQVGMQPPPPTWKWSSGAPVLGCLVAAPRSDGSRHALMILRVPLRDEVFGRSPTGSNAKPSSRRAEGDREVCLVARATYVRSELSGEHARASSAIPVLFLARSALTRTPVPNNANGAHP